jgi:ribose transport system substrate-binding protein
VKRDDEVRPRATRKRGRTFLLGLALVVLGLTVVACGGGSSSSSSSSTSEESSTTSTQESESSGGSAFLEEAKAETEKLQTIPTETAASALGAFTPKPDQTIYQISCTLELEGCKRFTEAVQDAGKAIGYKVEVCNAKDPEATAQCFTNAVNAHPDIVTSQGVGITEAEAGYKELEKAGIPIVPSYSGDTVESAPPASTIVNGDTCLKEGRAIGNWIIADSEGEGDVVAYTTKTFKCSEQRQTGLEESLEKCDTCSLKTVEFSIETMQTALPQQVQADLQSDPNVDYMTGAFATAALSVADSVRQAGKAESVQVASYDGDAANLELMRKGEIIGAETTSGLSEDGWLTVNAAARVLAGEEVPPIVPGTLLLIDAENVEKLGGPQFPGVPDFEAKIEELWE